MEVLHAAEAQRARMEALQHVEHLDQRHAARAWRRHRDELVAPISAFHRRPPDGSVILQILTRDEAAVRQHFFFEQGRGFALIETGGTL